MAAASEEHTFVSQDGSRISGRGPIYRLRRWPGDVWLTPLFVSETGRASGWQVWHRAPLDREVVVTSSGPWLEASPSWAIDRVRKNELFYLYQRAAWDRRTPVGEANLTWHPPPPVLTVEVAIDGETFEFESARWKAHWSAWQLLPDVSISVFGKNVEPTVLDLMRVQNVSAIARW